MFGVVGRAGFVVVGSVFGGSVLTGSVFGGSVLTGSVLTGSLFGGSDFTGSVFGGSVPTGSVLTGSDADTPVPIDVDGSLCGAVVTGRSGTIVVTSVRRLVLVR